MFVLLAADFMIHKPCLSTSPNDPQVWPIHKSGQSTSSSILKRHEERIPLTIQHEAIRMEPSNRVHMVHKLWKIRAMSPLEQTCVCVLPEALRRYPIRHYPSHSNQRSGFIWSPFEAIRSSLSVALHWSLSAAH